MAAIVMPPRMLCQIKISKVAIAHIDSADSGYIETTILSKKVLAMVSMIAGEIQETYSEPT